METVNRVAPLSSTAPTTVDPPSFAKKGKMSNTLASPSLLIECTSKRGAGMESVNHQGGELESTR